MLDGVNGRLDVTEEKISESEDIGIEEYFDRGGVTIIEWSDMIKDILPEERLDIKFKITGENTRVLVLNPHGERYTSICEEII